MWAASCLASCCTSCTCGLCTTVAGSISRRSARLAYCGLFALSLIISWILREAAAPLLEKIPWINTFTHTPSKEWFQTSAVLRVSLANFLFFLIFALLMIGVKDQNDRRDSWHHGGWVAKIIVWILLIVLMFFLPNIVITIYETSCKFGSGFFLLVQVVILLDFIHSWNDAWVEKDEQKWFVALLSITIVCYLATYAFSGVLFVWFKPSGHACGLNVFFIVMTMILAFVFGVIALHPQVNGSLLPASLVSLYCAYLCYTALSSEPRDYACNGLHNHAKQVSASTLALGMITTILSVVYSAVRAGSSTTFLSPSSSPRGSRDPLLSANDAESGKQDKKDAEARPVSYSYTFFHLIFAAHSDPGGMTILLVDDHVTGLQVRKDDAWITVRPLPDAFIVNMGDQIQVLSNAAYKSVEHRVKVNADAERLSMAFFYNPKSDVPMAPMPELVTADRPALYQPMTFDEYRVSIRKKGPRGKSLAS